jgi:hypothetical protein
MDDTVYGIFGKQPAHSLEITDVGLDESVVGTVLNVLEVSQVAGISELVHIDDMVIRIPVYKTANDMASYKTGTSGNQYVST